VLEATSGTIWSSVQEYQRAGQASLAQLTATCDHGPIPADVIPLVTCMRNERTLVEPFLDHYRRLGIGRFLIVDNGSTDGSCELLAAAPDVDLWRTDASYAGANQGLLWLEGLMRSRASGRWVMRTDLDEFLVFAGMQTQGIAGLVRRLEHLGESRLHAPMLDVYSDRPILETKIGPGDDPLQICSWFDPEPDLESRAHDLWACGGPRRRLFFEAGYEGPALTKYPLVYFDDETAYVSSHMPTPYSDGRLIAKGRLLHVKLHSELLDRSKQAAVEQQYWRQSFEYKHYLATLSQHPAVSAHTPQSRRYAGPESLIAAGLMRSPYISSREGNRFQRALELAS
jgi:hypothetical protein